MATKTQRADGPRRRRFSPEVRRSMILDKTAEMIARDGVSCVSFEAIALEAGISKSLVYTYFEGVPELLKELLNRELRGLRRLQIKAAEGASTFEELVRGTTHEYLKYIETRGLIIERLQADPNLSGGHDPTFYGRQASIDYLAPIVAKQFEMPMDLARAATEVSFGLPASAGEYLLRGQIGREALEELTVSMIIGSIVTARNDYLTRQGKFDR